MHRALLTGLMALSACTTAPATGGAAPALASDDPDPKGCALSIRFGSYAMGVDRGAAERVEALLASEPDVATTRHRWGREGEFTLCARTSPATAEGLFERIRPLLPATPRGPIHVGLGDGRQYSAPAQ